MKRIHLDFSSATRWSELTQEELIYILKLRAQGLNETQQKGYLFFRSNKIKPIKQRSNGWTIEWNKIRVFLEDWQLLGLLKPLQFLDEVIPSEVVSVRILQGIEGVHPYLWDGGEGVISLTFKQYLDADASYQDYLQTQDISSLQSLAKILYPDLISELREWEKYAVLMWWSSVKLFLSKQYSELFRPAPGASEPDLLAAVNGQIRALTSGDITKEEQVLKMNVHRGLTELDAKAREVRELKERAKKDV